MNKKKTLEMSIDTHKIRKNQIKQVKNTSEINLYSFCKSYKNTCINQ